MGCNQLLRVNECVDIDQTKSGKISAQPHSTLCIQFLDRENNDKNNTLPLGKQICFSIVWGCTEILPKTFLLLINKHSWLWGPTQLLRVNECVDIDQTKSFYLSSISFVVSEETTVSDLPLPHPTGLPISSPLTSGDWLSSAVFSHPCESTGASRVFLISRILTSCSLQLRGCQVEPCVCAVEVSFLRFLAATSSVFLSSLDESSSCQSLLVFDFDVPSWFLLVRWQSCDCFSSRRACLSSFWGEIRGSTHPGNPWKQTDHMFGSSVSLMSAIISIIVSSPPRSRHGTLILAGKWCHSTSWLRN